MLNAVVLLAQIGMSKLVPLWPVATVVSMPSSLRQAPWCDTMLRRIAARTITEQAPNDRALLMVPGKLPHRIDLTSLIFMPFQPHLAPCLIDQHP